MFTKEALKQQMRAMGLVPTDRVLIHTSYKAVGEVEGGPNGLIDAFCEYLSHGLFLVPTHTWDNVNAEHPVYDVRSTVPCIGAVPRAAAARGDGFRSLHPTHSLWAHGEGAEEFLAGEEHACTPTPPGSVWATLPERGVKILLLGVGNDKNTFLHSLDELLDIPDRLQREPWEVTIIDREGRRFRHPQRGHYCSRTNDVSQYFTNFEKPFVELGAQKFGKLGNATVRIIDPGECRRILTRILSRATEDLCVSHMDLPEALYR